MTETTASETALRKKAGPGAAVIRRMTVGDAPALHAVHTCCLTLTLSDFYSGPQIDAWLEGRTPDGYVQASKAGERFFVAETEGLVVGFGSWQNSELLSLYVHPGAQNHGLGARLLDACLTDAAGRKIAALSLNAALGSDGFYARHGFKTTGVGRIVKQGEKIAFTRMTLSLANQRTTPAQAQPRRRGRGVAR
jgi:GNAT superfamily N-acetyltransferase